jgi:hypothetical protein
MQHGRFRATGMMNHHPQALHRSSVATLITEQAWVTFGKQTRVNSRKRRSLIIAKRLAAPIRGDEREQPVFNLVPFAGARREVTDGN